VPVRRDQRAEIVQAVHRNAAAIEDCDRRLRRFPAIAYSPHYQYDAIVRRITENLRRSANPKIWITTQTAENRWKRTRPENL
jgi:hypothetical protein